MKNEQQTFSIELDQNDFADEAKMAEFQKLMNEVQDETIAYIVKLAQELGVSFACADDVFYLRTRSRHTPELEAELIRLYKEGKPPNVCEFG